MNQRNNPCTWCGNAGYFGDFAPGIYPMPCPHCGGTGLEGIISQEASEKISTLRNELYERIGKETDRWKVASESFKSTLLSMCAQTEQERKTHAHDAMVCRKRLGEFPMSYLSIEERCLQESWRRVRELVDPKYHPLIAENSRQVLGKSYRQNSYTEVARAAMHGSPMAN